MKNKKLIMLVLMLSAKIFAQDKMTKQEFNKQKDSLLREKKELNLLKTKYNVALDSLFAIDVRLDTLLNEAKSDILRKKYGAKKGANLAAKMVWTGMTEKMLLDSWDSPDSSNVNRYSYGIFTQHIYGDITFFFRDHKLIDWEQGENKGKSDKPIKLSR